ncbi:MAG TPA: ATP-binding protein [Oligoflexia bacterium]|nr:ATP-binding protein [Oligoflexia bacterium]HMP47874.1 ATP-binding protein [Oligoflexia bacterium]
MKPAGRYIKSSVLEFLEKRMVFIGGPRQVGKTTLALSFIRPSSRTNSSYLNWDDIHSRSLIRKGELPDSKIILLDEIHKYRGWRNLVKGFFDKRKDSQKFIITGSARLDYYRRGGDSLLGRYRYIRLHPFSVSELGIHTKNDLESLLAFGGFPEPFMESTEKFLKLWHRERLYRIVNDDIRDLENIKNLNSLEILAEILPERVASPLSVSSLAEDLSVNYRTIEKWIQVLEQVYFCYRISPFGSPKIRAVKKEKKLYLWDWSQNLDQGSRFENMVASHLLKYCHFLEDTEGDVMELRYLRDTDRREIDFVVLKNKKPIFAVECKTGEKDVSKHISYFKDRTEIPKFYQVHLGSKDYLKETGVRVLPFLTFCKEVLGV